MIISNTNLESMLLVFMMVTATLEQYLNALLRIKTAILKFMKRDNLNLHWISDSRFSCCWVTFKNLICIIDPPKAVGGTGRQYILSKHDFDKITTLVNQP